MKEMFHRMGFTPRLMGEVLQACNFKYKIYSFNFDIVAVIGDINDYSQIEKSLRNYYWAEV